MTKMLLPDTCPKCLTINEIDWENLECRPLSKLDTQLGYHCQACGTWKPCGYTNRSLDDQLKRLDSMHTAHKSFRHHFVKTYKRAEDIQRRGKDAYGSLGYKNLVATG